MIQKKMIEYGNNYKMKNIIQNKFIFYIKEL